MTKTPLSAAAALFIVTLTVKADYSYGKNEYYRPDYYSTPPPTYYSPAPIPPPPPTTQSENDNEGYIWYSPDFAGPYFRAEVGPSLFSDTHLMHFGVPANDHVRFKPGFAVNAAGGFQFNPNVSVDFEVGLNGAEVDHINFFTYDRANYYNLPFMANIMGTLPLDNGHIVPYIGGGVGAAAAIFDAQNLTTPANPTISGTESTAVFAAQFFVGARFRINPRTWL